MRIHSLALAVLLALIPSLARADGDEALGETLVLRGPGYGLAEGGVGFAGRFAPAAATTGTIRLAGIPAGATIRHAYLYWIINGAELDTTVVVDGTTVTGTVIGTAGDTCWDPLADVDVSAQPNITYRADITAIVDGNGDYVVSGLPQHEAERDTQGASILVVYQDPASDADTFVRVHDGARVLRGGSDINIRFGGFEPATVLSASVHLAAGDGELNQPDGLVRFGASPPLPPPPGSILSPGGPQQWAGRLGDYWDVNVYDVTAHLDLSMPTATMRIGSPADCLAFGYAALIYTVALTDPDDAGVPVDGGIGADGGVAVDGGRADAGARLDGGGSDGGRSASPSADESGGCGCVVPSGSRSSPRSIVLGMLALAVLLLRRRR